MAIWRQGLVGGVVLAGVVFASGCGYTVIKKSEYARIIGASDKLASAEARAGNLEKENAQLQARVRILEQSGKTSSELLAMLQADRVKWETGHGAGQGDLFKPSEKGLTAELQAELLFDSGKAELKPAGQAKLKEIAARLNSATDAEIEVAGYTDSDPIKRSKWDTNRELSGARAYQVLKYLTGPECKVDPARAYFAGYGEHKLKMAGGKEDKKASRRVEVTILYPTAAEATKVLEAPPALPPALPAPETPVAPPAPVLK